MIPTLPPPPPLESSYSLAYAWTVYRTFQTLLKLPYNMMRRANLVVRIQASVSPVLRFGGCGCEITGAESRGGKGANWARWHWCTQRPHALPAAPNPAPVRCRSACAR